MTTLNHLLDLEEQICYVQCGYCTTILLVSVPCNSLSKVVTVRCGHCTSLLSVHMIKSSLFPLHLFTPLNQDDPAKLEVSPGAEVDISFDSKPFDLEKHSSPPPADSSSTSDEEDDDLVLANHVVNKPPEKRPRAPSAYNCFIKEEIRRLKTNDPSMTHKQAFSTAAKNWAHFPQSQHNVGGGESSCYSLGEEEI